MIIYTIKNGDSLYSIARRYGTTSERIALDNGITNPAALTVGQTIVIRQPEVVYTVEEGDNLYSIAQRFGVTVNQLWRNNPDLDGKTELTPGQSIVVEDAPVTNEGEIAVNAYVYPSVDRDVLRRTLPYLTYLTLFTYGIEDDGELIGIDDEEIIELARQYGVAPIMLVSTLGSDGKFSNELAVRILSDENIQNTLINDIVRTVGEKRYSGVDVDFEYVPGEYAQAYADFVRKLNDSLDPEGYLTFVALAPKTSADQPGLLYEGHDYAALGEAADKALLMTYEWGYTYGPPMAVSPENKVREVVEYAITEIPPEKLFLGVPNYGYNWKLPYVRGESMAQSLSNVDALKLAGEKRAAIQFDETAASPFFRYFERGDGGAEEHVVWFEDARTVAAALDLVREFGLYGIGIWNAMRYFPQLWLVLNSTYNISKILR